MGRKKLVQSLGVYLNGTLVGKLRKEVSGEIAFKYDSNWIPKNFAISNSLPIQEQEYKGEIVSRYFDNLLPDNEDIKKNVAEKFAAESTRPFDILSAIGRDCVGALSFLPDDEEVPDPFKIDSKKISEKKIAQRIRGLSSSTPLGMEKGDFRISLAGAQEKTALLRLGSQWHEPQGLTPTTHIIKTPIGALGQEMNFSDSVDNEWASLFLASKLGLETCESWIENFEDQRVLVVERFDRQWTKWKGKDALIRIPQEDMCQALGYSPYKKYQNDGGPSIKEISAFLGTSKDPEDRQKFFRSLIIFDLIYATDGHAKNFSVYLSPQGMNLTPGYDIMSGYFLHAREGLSWQKLKLAMAVGNSKHYNFPKITVRQYRETAKAAFLGKDDFDKLWEDVKQRALNLTISDDELDPELDPITLELLLEGFDRRKKWLYLL